MGQEGVRPYLLEYCMYYNLMIPFIDGRVFFPLRLKISYYNLSGSNISIETQSRQQVAHPVKRGTVDNVLAFDWPTNFSISSLALVLGNFNEELEGF